MVAHLWSTSPVEQVADVCLRVTSETRHIPRYGGAVMCFDSLGKGVLDRAAHGDRKDFRRVESCA